MNGFWFVEVGMKPPAQTAHDRLGYLRDGNFRSRCECAERSDGRRSSGPALVPASRCRRARRRWSSGPATSVDAGSDRAHTAEVRRTKPAVRHLFDVIQTGDTAAIWSLFADDGVIEFPFLGLRITDFATLDAAIGPLLAVLGDLTYFDFVFEPLADPAGVIVTHKGHAVITFNSKSYDQTYINEVRVRDGKITSYVEYFDTAVLNAALTP